MLIICLNSFGVPYYAVANRWHTPCPNMCTGQGRCEGPYGVCKCYSGYTGADCSLRTCPKGPAWTDDLLSTTLTTDDEAHQMAECSNRGLCDRISGTCICEVGRFEGVACERKTCPNNCMSKGRCVSAQVLASMQDPGLLLMDEGCTSTNICQDINCTIRDYSACAATFDYR